MKEPISHFLAKEGFDLNRVSEWVIGKKYVGLMLDNGHIGVCATLDRDVKDDLLKGVEPDSSNPSHRIILNAWFNALCNYRRSYNETGDIFDSVDFGQFSNIVMIGYFESLYEKFRRTGIELKVFDIMKESAILASPKSMGDSLLNADTVILTGTTIFNNTFLEVLNSTGHNCSVLLLGPSNILSDDMFAYRNIKVVYGSVFKPFDHDLFDKIRDGHGTRGFIENLKKVYINSENNYDDN